MRCIAPRGLSRCLQKQAVRQRRAADEHDRWAAQPTPGPASADRTLGQLLPAERSWAARLYRGTH